MADREWTADCVADHFEEAFRTLRKLPPVKAQGYFNTWPDIVRTSREIAAMEPQPMRVWPSAAAITRLEQTFDWVLWIEEAERKLERTRANLLRATSMLEGAAIDKYSFTRDFYLQRRQNQIESMIDQGIGLPGVQDTESSN